MLKIPLTEAQYDEKVAELAKNGITLNGRQGEVDKEGVTVSYAYQNGTLTLQVMRKPVFVSLAYCEGKLKGWLGNA